MSALIAAWLRAEAEEAERENTARGGSVAALRMGTRELLLLLDVCEAARAVSARCHVTSFVGEREWQALAAALARLEATDARE